MTRPELPPGWGIRPYPGDPDRLVLVCGGRWASVQIPSSDRAALVARAWRQWTEQNPEWAVYLEHLEADR